MPKNKPPIPEKFNSIEEIQDFWDHHSTADYWDGMEEVDLRISPQLKSKIELKKLYKILGFSPYQIAEIEERAKGENISSKQLIYKWVLEHI